MTVNKEKIESVIRALIQIVGVLIALGVGGQYIPLASDVLNYLVENIGTIFNAANEIIGIAIALYGFFKNEDRFEARAIASQVRSKAHVKRMTVQEYLEKA